LMSPCMNSGSPRIFSWPASRQGGLFEAAVELDALEALHPGELARLVRERILRFRDPSLWEKVAAARREAEEKLATAWEEYLGPYRDRLEELREKVAAVTARYQARLDELRAALEADLEPYRKELEMLQLAVQNAVDQLDIELPPLPEPETVPEDQDWLFDSRRDYFAQLAAYRARRGDTS